MMKCSEDSDFHEKLMTYLNSRFSYQASGKCDPFLFSTETVSVFPHQIIL